MKLIVPLLFFGMILMLFTKRVSGGYVDIIVDEYRKEFPFLPSSLIMAFIEVESSFNVNAYNEDGDNEPSIGLMQIKLSTARDMGFLGNAMELYRPATNIYYGMKYLAWLKDRFPQDFVGMIMSYNEGLGNYRKGKRVWGYYGKIIRAQKRY